MSLATTAQEDAETKFWRMPELIERLLEYLDEFSILSIVGLNLLTLEVLQTASRTSKPLPGLIRRVLRFDQRESFEQQREKVRRFSNTLLAQSSSEPLLLEVLDVICFQHKYVGAWVPHPGIHNVTNYNQKSVIKMSCPLHKGHHMVSPLGIILLEDCEAALAISSTKLSVIDIMLDGREDMSDTKRC